MPCWIYSYQESPKYILPAAPDWCTALKESDGNVILVSASVKAITEATTKNKAPGIKELMRNGAEVPLSA